MYLRAINSILTRALVKSLRGTTNYRNRRLSSLLNIILKRITLYNN